MKLSTSMWITLRNKASTSRIFSKNRAKCGQPDQLSTRYVDNFIKIRRIAQVAENFKQVIHKVINMWIISVHIPLKNIEMWITKNVEMWITL
jgi:hypothetical protein